MKQFEVQKPISQLLANILRVNFFQVGCSEQSNKTHNFRKIFFLTSSLYNSIVYALPIELLICDLLNRNPLSMEDKMAAGDLGRVTNYG